MWSRGGGLTPLKVHEYDNIRGIPKWRKGQEHIRNKWSWISGDEGANETRSDTKVEVGHRG